jgi:hypothetical protein
LDTVAVYLCNTTESEVRAYLDRCFPGQRDPWLVCVGGDPCLYINIHDDMLEFDCMRAGEQLASLRTALGGDCSHIVAADISGRHYGTNQATRFITTMLSRFRGVAVDDYTEHFWTLEEIQRGDSFEGLKFCDSKGFHRLNPPGSLSAPSPDDDHPTG